MLFIFNIKNKKKGGGIIINYQNLKKVKMGLHLIPIIKDTLKFFLLLTSLAFILGACSSSNSEDKKSSECFKFNEDRTQITGYLKIAGNGKVCIKDVIIPDGVTGIAENAFKDRGLTSVEIIESVIDIGAHAFSGNSFSSYVYIPNENANVDISAFDSSVVVVIEGTESCFVRDANDQTVLTGYFCLATTVEIPDGVAEIRDEVFKDKRLISVVIPSSVTRIGNFAFAGNLDLEPIIFSGPGPTIGTGAFTNGYIVETTSTCFEFDAVDTRRIVDYYDNENNNSNNLACPRDIVILRRVISIGDSAFENNSLTSVDIPDNVTSIGSHAFSENSLTSVDIPDNVTSIGDSAFENNSLTSVDIPDNVTSIGSHAFSENSLTSVDIPDNVTSIGSHAFSKNSLTSVDIPDSVSFIDDHAFSKNSLTSVDIPDDVTSIGSHAFSKNSLTSVDIPDSVSFIDDHTFSENSLTSVDIPDDVTSIGSHAFSKNSLTSVIIGSGEINIKEEAFTNNNSSLTVCIEAQIDDVIVDSVIFDSGITPTYEADGDCTN